MHYSEPPCRNFKMQAVVNLPTGRSKAGSFDVLKWEFLEILNISYQDYVEIYTNGSVNKRQLVCYNEFSTKY